MLSDFDSLWDYEQPAETEKRFRELLPAAEENTSYYLQLLTQIARAQGLQRQFEDAHQTLNRVEPRIKTDEVVEIRYLLERGRVFNSSGQPKKARPLFLEAYEIALAVGEDFYAVDAAHMLAILESPLEWNEIALALAENSTDARARAWRGSLYNNLGWAYHDRGEYEKALEIFQKALVFRQEQGKDRPMNIAKWCVARCLRSLNRIPEALEILRELEKVEKTDGFVDEELAKCLLLSEDEQAALPYFRQAYEKLSQDEWLAANEPKRLARLKAYGAKLS